MAAQHGVDWTQVLLYGVPAYIAAFGGAIAAVVASLNRRNLKTPSGDAIGKVAERTHDLAALSTLAVSGVTATGPMVDAGRRLNASAEAPVKVNGEIVPDAGPNPPAPGG